MSISPKRVTGKFQKQSFHFNTETGMCCVLFCFVWVFWVNSIHITYTMVDPEEQEPECPITTIPGAVTMLSPNALLVCPWQRRGQQATVLPVS